MPLHSGFTLVDDGVIRGNTWGLSGITGASPTLDHTGDLLLTTLVDIDLSAIQFAIGDIIKVSFGFITTGNGGVINTADYLNLSTPPLEAPLSGGMNLQPPTGTILNGKFESIIQILPDGGSGNALDICGFTSWSRAVSGAINDAGNGNVVFGAASTGIINYRHKVQLFDAADMFSISGFLLTVNGVRL